MMNVKQTPPIVHTKEKKTRLPETLGVGVELDLDGARFGRREDRGRRRGSDRGNDGDAAPVVGPAPAAVVVVDVVDVDVDEGVAGGGGELLVLPLPGRPLVMVAPVLPVAVAVVVL